MQVCALYTVYKIFIKNTVFWIQNTVSRGVSPIYYIIFYIKCQFSGGFREKTTVFFIFCSNLLTKAMEMNRKWRKMRSNRNICIQYTICSFGRASAICKAAVSREKKPYGCSDRNFGPTRPRAARTNYRIIARVLQKCEPIVKNVEMYTVSKTPPGATSSGRLKKNTRSDIVRSGQWLTPWAGGVP